MSIDNNDQQVAEPTVRLCMLRTWPQHFDGYGFNLHAEKTKPVNGNIGLILPFSGGQYVGKVDRGSPAESAGLREGDRIVQVEGVDIEGEPHTKVVARIKKGSASDDAGETNDSVSRCSILVVDRRADTYYREHNIKVHSDMGLQVLVLRTPEDPTSECLALQQTATTTTPSTNNGNDGTKQENDSVDTVIAPTTDNSTTTSTASSTTSTTTTLNLNMTAAELRRRLAESKKQDARRTGCTGDFRQKHDMVDKL